MSQFQDFFIDSFSEGEVIEKQVKMGGSVRKMKFKPVSAAKGDEIRKKIRKATTKNGQRVVEHDETRFVNELIVESLVHPNLKDKELQENWGVIGAEELFLKMKSKMTDGEYGALALIAKEVNGYDQDVNEIAEEVKN